MTSNLGFYSYLSATISFTLLLALLASSALRKSHGKNLFFACGASVVWALYIATSTTITSPFDSFAIALLEWVRYVAWLHFIMGMMRTDEHSSTHQSAKSKSFIFYLLSIITLVIITVPEAGLITDQDSLAWANTVKMTTLIVVNIVGLAMIEQIIRNSTDDQRWIIKYLCVGLGSIFTYDFFMYSEGLLFKQLDASFWQARGLVNALIVPLIAVSAARHRTLNLGIHVSRHVTFHSATVIAAGVYLLAMSAMGYYVRYISGTWGNLLQILFLFGAGIVLATLLASHKLRLTLKVLLNKHFYNYKYDYRQQWLDFTDNLANTEGEVPERTCQAIAQLVHSSGALLWIKGQNDQYELLTHWHIRPPEVEHRRLDADLRSVDQFLQESLWVIDIAEYQHDRPKYPDLVIPDWILSIPKAWLLVPFIFQNKVLGFILLRRSDISRSINWEDRDLLKMAGQQAAIHLAQYQSENALIEARQFEAYNRLSTYVMHDLKNILAQQSLIVSNAERHRDKPEFIDDVISTVENSVDRMNRLLRQMKVGLRQEAITEVSISHAIEASISTHTALQPVPTFNRPETDRHITTDKSQLVNILGHFIQNAQEATPNHGSINIDILYSDQLTKIIIADTGTGMDAQFIKDRLFKPFDSTKGLAGMGIGAFESRQYILSLGGDLKVHSVPGKGTEFIIQLPASAENSESVASRALENNAGPDDFATSTHEAKGAART